MQLSKPFISVTYNGKDISEDISKYFISYTYTDHVHGKSDELEIELEDTRGLWIGSWYPEKGAPLTSKFGFIGLLVSAGTFQIDEVEASGPPDVIRMRSIATGITKAVRTKNSFAHEDKTLRQIANVIAQKHGFTVAGEIAEIRIERATQNRETDLEFLKRIAGEYGYVFSIRDKVITFSNVYDLEGVEPVTELDKSDVSQYQFTDKLVGTYKRARSKHHKPGSKKAIEGYANLDGSGSGDASSDDLEIRHKAENQQQAEAQAKAALHKKNSKGTSGTLTCPGNPYLVAGNNITLTGFGKLSGTWHIEQSRHTITSGGGYITEIECKRVKAAK